VIDKEIVLVESGGVDRDREFVRIGIPFAQGELPDQEELAMLNPHGDLQPVQVGTLKRWHDGSIKWLLLDFAASVPADGRSSYRLVNAFGTLTACTPAIRITQEKETWLVHTGSSLFSVDSKIFRPFSRIVTGGHDMLAPGEARCIFDLGKEHRLIPVVDAVAVETEGPLRATLRINGRFGPDKGAAPQFFCRLHFFADSSRVIVEFTLRNPQPAKHPGGLWDLGDPGSVMFRELALEFPFFAGSVEKIVCSPEQNIPPGICSDPAGRISIYQESSGGENWKSPIHRSQTGTIPLTMRGYEMQNTDGPVFHGDRANPVIWCGGEENGLAAVIPRFWQEFPKAIEADRSGLRIALFPSRFPEIHELQGGEQKTTTVYLDFSTSPDGLDWARTPLTAIAVPEIYRDSCVIPDLPPPAPAGNGICDLVDRFIPGPEALLGRRESTDEYGWRNFGDLPADHESVYHKGEETFISHYNNQYDLCGGMYRKFFATGDPHWCELASDLARHVLDIDLYRTTEDREEYNGGLFWHTDHYIPAGLSTHRSFSREHLLIKDPRFCGGGPAAEHCYTTGLLYHYFITGNSDYREAVIALAEWCIGSITGSQTILASIRKAGHYIKLLVQSRDGARPAFPRYPLNRGTGNAITACLDAFEAGGGGSFLEQAGELLHGAIHPADDIASRDLLNAEDSWSYTVLLTAVSKYIDKKRELGELDDGYLYAKSCLLAYAEWMLQHEYPYLDKPEILEYPNETWPAQDLRKSVILYHAARLSAPEKRDILLERARFFYEAARDELARHPTSSFTRPVALMLQNGWIGARLNGHTSEMPVYDPIASSFGRPTPQLGIYAVIARICGDMWRAARKFRPGREVAWLNMRLQGRRTDAGTAISVH
jgi:hypothetical protein